MDPTTDRFFPPFLGKKNQKDRDREREVSFRHFLDTVFRDLCVLSMGKRCAPVGVIVVLMSSLVISKERWPW